VDFAELMGRDQSFGVEAERYGDHPFTSVDVASAVGRAVIESCLASEGWRPRVDLKSPDVQLYALVRDDEFLLGINLTGPSLHKRFYRVADVRSTLPPTLAFLMVLRSGWEPSGCLLDPFCGSGTIPIEAALTPCPCLRTPTGQGSKCRSSGCASSTSMSSRGSSKGSGPRRGDG